MILGNYTILEKLGEGGMATVHLAMHNKLNIKVAVKVLREDYLSNKNIRSRFLAEAKNLAILSHPNIIKVTDLFDEINYVAFVMEYIEGITLKEYIDRKAPLSYIEIKTIFLQMLDAVGYVHEHNLIHRDIKPSNFMVTKNGGGVKLLDFGIAKNTNSSSLEYTQTGTTQNMGTPMYMSPEQIKSTKDVTLQSDIYSLGVVLWQIVTGTLPYNLTQLSIPEIQVSILKENLPLTNTQWDLINQKATAKQTIDRYLSYLDIIEELKKFQNFDNFIFDSRFDNSNNLQQSSANPQYSTSFQQTVFEINDSANEEFIEKNTPKKILIDVSILNEDGDLKYGVVDINGDWIIPPKYDYIYLQDDGLIVQLSGNYGYMDFDGNWIIFPKFDRIDGFDKFGYSNATKTSYGFFNNTTLYGRIDKKGNWVVKPIFELLGNADEFGNCVAQMNNKYGLIDKDGIWILPPIYQSLYSFDKFGYTAQLNGKAGKIDIKGNWQISPQFDAMHSFDDQGYCSVMKKEKFGLIDLDANLRVNLIFDSLFNDDSKGYTAQLNGKAGKINRKGEWIIKPNYTYLSGFSETSFSIARTNEKYGIVNTNGEWHISPTYTELTRINNELFKASIDSNKYGVINLKNEWILSPIYDYILLLF